MNKLKEYLQKNNKILINILITVWMFFMLKLWLMWFSIKAWSSWWFLALPSLWSFEYTWMSAWYISLLFIILSIFLIYKIRYIKNGSTKLKIALFILILWLLSKQIFFIFAPDFKFYMTPVTKQYKDKEWNVTDVDKYLELVGKYCDYKVAGILEYRKSRGDMCSENDKYQTFFKTADEYIKVLEYAKNNDDRTLYQRTYWWVNKFWVEKILGKYDDVTFQAYVIDKIGDLEKLKSFIAYIKNPKLIEILNNNIGSIEYYNNNKDKFTQNEWYDYWDKLSNDFTSWIKQIPEVNYKIF